jgi:hypothetical protein
VSISNEFRDIRNIQEQLAFLECTVQPDFSAVQDFIKEPTTLFDVCYINPLVGYGLIAKQDIPADTVIGIYTLRTSF